MSEDKPVAAILTPSHSTDDVTAARVTPGHSTDNVTAAGVTPGHSTDDVTATQGDPRDSDTSCATSSDQSEDEGESQPLIDGASQSVVQSAPQLPPVPAPRVTSPGPETTQGPRPGVRGQEDRAPLVDSEEDLEDEEQLVGAQAPPLPEKRPLSSSHDDVSSVGSSSSSTMSEVEPEYLPTEFAVPVGGATQTAPAEGATSASSPTDGPAPEGGATPTAAETAAAGSDVTVTVQPGMPPNEPPPPYPGGPLPGADLYGPPGSPGEIVVIHRASGNCPKCEEGNVLERFSFCGICLAIWLFPCGLICLFCMKEKKCSHCSEKF